jgi:hypothetical protein
MGVKGGTIRLRRTLSHGRLARNSAKSPPWTPSNSTAPPNRTPANSTHPKRKLTKQKETIAKILGRHIAASPHCPIKSGWSKTVLKSEQPCKLALLS